MERLLFVAFHCAVITAFNHLAPLAQLAQLAWRMAR
jgi:hypothetical protein